MHFLKTWYKGSGVRNSGLLTFQSFDIKLSLANKSLLNEHQNSLTTSLLGEGVGEVFSRVMFSGIGITLYVDSVSVGPCVLISLSGRYFLNRKKDGFKVNVAAMI